MLESRTIVVTGVASGLQVYTMQNRWTGRDRGIRMSCVSRGPVDTPILPGGMSSHIMMHMHGIES